jgi:hypothetical protein
MIPDGERTCQNAKPSETGFLTFNWRTRLVFIQEDGVSSA